MNNNIKKKIEQRANNFLENAVDAYNKGLSTYRGLKNLGQDIGAEYGDRVLFELIQNAHDAHLPKEPGRIAINLDIKSENEGTLIIANEGCGFQDDNFEAITSLADSGKEIGAGIGNKGLGFRSIEAITDNIHIYSQSDAKINDRFDGYCFRFASEQEIQKKLKENGLVHDDKKAHEIAKDMPCYFVPIELTKPLECVSKYAKHGYATAIVAPLRGKEAIELIERQINNITDPQIPLLLFLDRVSEIHIEITGDNPHQTNLKRYQTKFRKTESNNKLQIHKVEIGKERQYLIVSRQINKKSVLDAVERSIETTPKIEKWRNWEGKPTVSVAVGLSPQTINETGRLYNFLPMGETAVSPIIGHVDAPFYTRIDRREASFAIPLNEHLMQEIAETCLLLAEVIVEDKLSVPSHTACDLISWDEHIDILESVVEQKELSLTELPYIPIVSAEKTKRWSDISHAKIWPDSKCSILKKKELVKHTEAHIVSPKLGDSRLDRLRKILRSSHYTYRIHSYDPLDPDEGNLCEWFEDYAKSLHTRNKKPSTWSKFYKDVVQVCEDLNVEPNCLNGKRIIWDNTKKLRTAGEYGNCDIYIRRNKFAEKQTKSKMPMPPVALAKRYKFINDEIKLAKKVQDKFIENHLIQEFDSITALADLNFVLDENPSVRKSALFWAFEVWRLAGGDADDALKSASLYVPDTSGKWILRATEAAFSSSWTQTGKRLDKFLASAAKFSKDCKESKKTLLMPLKDWGDSKKRSREDWVRFLKVIGVTDGLKPTYDEIEFPELSGSYWNNLLSFGNPELGLDETWCDEVSNITKFNHPYTDYMVHEESQPWRLPGQLEYDQLPTNAKKYFCKLVIQSLKNYKDKFFLFRIGRYDRNSHQRDERSLPTPLASFLRNSEWVALKRQGIEGFSRPRDCWISRKGNDRPPDFITQVIDDITELAEDNKLSDFIFGEDLGFMDWSNQKNAPNRLSEFGKSAGDLKLGDRLSFVKGYKRAWKNFIEAKKDSPDDLVLPDDLMLGVDQGNQIKSLGGNKKNPPKVYLIDNAKNAYAFSSHGEPVLEVSESLSEGIEEHLLSLGTFAPQRLNDKSMRPVVDGERFTPSKNDRLLTEIGLEWLPEVVVFANQKYEEQSESNVQNTRIYKRVKALRVRRCSRINLVIDENKIPFKCYALRHKKYPTLILDNSVEINWRTLVKELSSHISLLINFDSEALNRILQTLCIDSEQDKLISPTEEMLAEALGCSTSELQSMRESLYNDLTHITDLLIPVVGYLEGIDVAKKLRNKSKKDKSDFNAKAWLKKHLTVSEPSFKTIYDACKNNYNHAVVREALGLNYKKFNKTLRALEMESLGNEDELCEEFYNYMNKNKMRSEIIEQIRRVYFDDYQKKRNLDKYVEHKKLEFIEFNSDWVDSEEILSEDIIKDYVRERLICKFKEIPSHELMPLEQLSEVNREKVRQFAEKAMGTVNAWCRKKDVKVPKPWNSDVPQEIYRFIENTGVLDFEEIKNLSDIPDICKRVGCWPDGMRPTTDMKELGLDTDSIKKEEDKKIRERKRKREEAEKEERIIKLPDGREIDTTDPTKNEFIEKLVDEYSSDDEWYQRCIQNNRLAEVNSKNGSTGKPRREVQLVVNKQRQDQKSSEYKKEDIGYMGERLAYMYLRRHFGKNVVNEESWISGYRSRFCRGGLGNDAAGYDFLVQTESEKIMFEVKSSVNDSCEFELTENETRVAKDVADEGKNQYRILYVSNVFSKDKYCVTELPNPMDETNRKYFDIAYSASCRFKRKES